LPINLRTQTDFYFASILKMSNDKQPDNTSDTTKGNQQISPKIIIPPPMSPSERPTEEKPKENKGFFERWKYEIEFAGLIGLIFYCFVNWRELKVFDSERITMQQEFLTGETNAEKQMNIAQRQIDDAEAQQRALLKFGEITTKITTNNSIQDMPMYNLTISIPIKNVGYTPAIDLMGSGVGFEENDSTKMTEEILKKQGITNFFPKRWNRTNTPVPVPYNGDPFNGGTTVTIQPQDAITNTLGMGGEMRGGDYYSEQWISYKDIFRHSWIIGEGGHYDFTNNVFVLEFIYSQEYRPEDQTNSTPQKH
jgi:hypothetical protein